MKVVIHLYHGRKSPSDNLDDWGADGPLLGPFDGFHMTYLSHLRTIIDGENQADLKLVGDLIYYDGMFYGDMVVLSEEAAKKEFKGKEIESIDPEKCKIPEPTFGVKNVEDLDNSSDVVLCTNCERFYYESLGSERDTNYLQLLDEGENQFKGCGNCKTDSALMDVIKD